jgi:hypothetical protein
MSMETVMRNARMLITTRTAPGTLPLARRAVVLVVLGLCLAAPAAHVLAEDNYQSVVAEAIAEFQRQNWVEARALFKRAHEISPNARTLRGAGNAAFEAKMYVDAYQDLSAALESKVKPLTPAQRTEVQRNLARARTYISRLRVEAEPSDAELSIDGKPVVMEDGALLLDPGVHELSVRAAGHEPASQRVDAEPGEQREIRVELRPVQETSIATATPAITPAQVEIKADDAKPSGPNFGAWPWVAAGAALVLGGTGVGLHFASSAAVTQVEQACPVGKCTLSEINKRIDDGHIKTFDALAVVSWSLAGAAAVTSTVLFVLNRSSRTETQPATALRVGPASVAIAGRF